MTLNEGICWLAAVLSFGLAAVVWVVRRRSFAGWCFGAGMGVLGVEAVWAALSVSAVDGGAVARWQGYSLVTKSLIPVTWLAFSLSYSRGDWRGYLARWRWVLAAAVLLPVVVGGLLFGGGHPLLRVEWSEAGGGWQVSYALVFKLLHILSVGATVCVLANLERTFRAAVGTMQWRIKFVVLGLGLIFGARIYCRSQALIFSSYDVDLSVVEAFALILGCLLMGVGYARHGFAEIDIYPSRTVLEGSVVVLLVGVYLFVVGVLAQLARTFGGTGNFQLQALVVLGGVVGLAVLLLSDRLRQKLRVFIGRHFRRPQHDSRVVWTQCTRRLSSGLSSEAYAQEAVRLVAGTFQALSVTLWVFDDRRGGVRLAATTARAEEDEDEEAGGRLAVEPLRQGLREMGGPFDLDDADQPWAEGLRHLSLRHFQNSGSRLCLPVFSGESGLGFLLLADRVNGVSYSVEELDLLRCIADHVGAGLSQQRLTEQLMHGRELEAFQAMSTFFVHDLKNAASSLNLMLQNLPEHFDDPEFRADALRAIGSTVDRIKQIIERLGSLRKKLEMRMAPTNLTSLVEEVISQMGGLGEVELAKDLQPVPALEADSEQLTTVLTNLLLNAREAVGSDGRISVSTAVVEGQAVVTVADNGPGMSPEFLRTSLFRPFQTTKKKGLGIGMFQSKLIVEAHLGSLQVTSSPGCGTTFRILLPLNRPTAVSLSPAT